MTYAIKFVNFTLAAPFQKKSRPLTGGCARSTRSMVATPMGIHCTFTWASHDVFSVLSSPISGSSLLFHQSLTLPYPIMEYELAEHFISKAKATISKANATCSIALPMPDN